MQRSGFTPSGSEPVTDDPVALDFADLARVESAALDLLPSGIGIFDNDFNLVYVNRSFRELHFLPEWLCIRGTRLEDRPRRGSRRPRQKRNPRLSPGSSPSSNRFAADRPKIIHHTNDQRHANREAVP